jgi:hypothetical protein
MKKSRNRICQHQQRHRGYVYALVIHFYGSTCVLEETSVSLVSDPLRRVCRLNGEKYKFLLLLLRLWSDAQKNTEFREYELLSLIY